MAGQVDTGSELAVAQLADDSIASASGTSRSFLLLTLYLQCSQGRARLLLCDAGIACAEKDSGHGSDSGENPDDL